MYVCMSVYRDRFIPIDDFTKQTKNTQQECGEEGILCMCVYMEIAKIKFNKIENKIIQMRTKNKHSFLSFRVYTKISEWTALADHTFIIMSEFRRY